MSAKQGTQAQFSATQWSTVLAARDWRSVEAREALARLCERYWYPLYAFVRRRGQPPHEAQDLTQEFFVHLFEHDALQHVDREKGRFRSFLLAALSNYLNNHWDRQKAQKRGGHQIFVPLDQLMAEERFTREPATPAAPERMFERHWANTLVEQVMQKLRAEYAAPERAAVYDALHVNLTGEPAAGFCAEVAGRLGMTESAVRVALHRLRRRFGEILRREIAETVADPADIDDEIRCLFAAVGG